MTRLLTLTGVGGCGKTRLALAAATAVLPEYPDGVWLVELAELTAHELVPHAAAAVLGVREEPQRALTATLVDALGSRTLLLVLDNCEHLLDSCAHLTATLLSACPRLRILATSRESLGVAGETTWPILSLALPAQQHLPPLGEVAQSEALQLFVERAATTLPTFTLTHENAAAVVHVCRQLEGIPLAIELAAARVKVLSMEQLAARLNDSLRLLQGGNRTALARQQTLRATFDWSYALLSEPERAVFRRLSVFAGGWTLEAAEVVCGRAGVAVDEVLELLAHLVDKSLIVVEAHGLGGARYRLLEIVRQYAQEQLRETEEAASTEEQHAVYFLALAQQAEPELRGPQQRLWLDRLEQEHANLRAALTWSQTTAGSADMGLRVAGALWWFWWVRGYWSEGRMWLERALAGGSGVSSIHAKALLGAGWLARAQGDTVQAAASLEESLALYRELGDTRSSAQVLRGLGWVAYYQGDRARAVPLLGESLARYRELSDQRGIADALLGLGWIALARGDLVQAATLVEESLARYRELGDRRGVADALRNLGWIAFDQGDRVRVTPLVVEGLAIYRELGDANGIADMHSVLGELARELGDYGRAKTFYEESLVMQRRLGSKQGMAHSLHNLGHVAHNESDDVRAAAHFAESLALFRELGNKLGIAYCLAGVGGVVGAHRQPEQAARLFGAAEALLEAIGAGMEAIERAAYEQNVATVRAQLDTPAFEAAWATGRALTLEQAIAEAVVGGA